MRRTKVVVLVTVACLVLHAAASAQQPQSDPSFGNGSNAAGSARLPYYILGPNDEIVILALDADEIANKPTRVTTSGDINLPLIGRIHVAGMNLEQLEAEVTQRLSKYIREPHVAINVTSFKSQPVSVFGAVGSAGVIQLEGRKTLIEVLSMAGGLRPEAGTIRITRKAEWGAIPLSSVV